MAWVYLSAQLRMRVRDASASGPESARQICSGKVQWLPWSYLTLGYLNLHSACLSWRGQAQMNHIEGGPGDGAQLTGCAGVAGVTLVWTQTR